MTLFLKFLAATFCSDLFSLPQNRWGQNFKSLLLLSFHGTEFQVVFSSAKGYIERNSESLFLFLFHETEFRVFFLFPGMVQNGIQRVCFYFCSKEQYSAEFFCWKLPTYKEDWQREIICWLERGGDGAESNDCKKAWSSINHKSFNTLCLQGSKIFN